MRSKECRNLIVWFQHCEVEMLLSASLLLHAIRQSSLTVSIFKNGNMQEICVAECKHSTHEVVADDIPLCPMHKAITEVMSTMSKAGIFYCVDKLVHSSSSHLSCSYGITSHRRLQLLQVQENFLLLSELCHRRPCRSVNVQNHLVRIGHSSTKKASDYWLMSSRFLFALVAKSSIQKYTTNKER